MIARHHPLAPEVVRRFDPEIFTSQYHGAGRPDLCLQSEILPVRVAALAPSTRRVGPQSRGFLISYLPPPTAARSTNNNPVASIHWRRVLRAEIPTSLVVLAFLPPRLGQPPHPEVKPGLRIA